MSAPKTNPKTKTNRDTATNLFMLLFYIINGMGQDRWKTLAKKIYFSLVVPEKLQVYITNPFFKGLSRKSY